MKIRIWQPERARTVLDFTVTHGIIARDLLALELEPNGRVVRAHVRGRGRRLFLRFLTPEAARAYLADVASTQN